jgi:hypothetical protein
MKIKIIYLMLMLFIFVGCTVNNVAIKKEVYLLEMENMNTKDRNNYFIGNNHDRLFYDFSIKYAGHVIIDKDNNFLFDGPKKWDFQAQLGNYLNDLPYEKITLFSEEYNAPVIKAFKEENKDKRGFHCVGEMGWGSSCIYLREIYPGTDEFAKLLWDELVYKKGRGLHWFDVFVPIDPKIGKKLKQHYDKTGIAEIDKKYHKDLYKYIQWFDDDSVYYVDGDYECLYKEGPRIRLKLDWDIWSREYDESELYPQTQPEHCDFD